MRFILERVRILSSFLSICILLAGCGESPQPALDEEIKSYQLTELKLPDSEAALMEQLWEDEAWQRETWLEQDWNYREKDSIFHEGSWYLFSQFSVPPYGLAATCVQVLAPPYDHWESYGISHNWDQENYSGWYVENLAGVAEDGVLLQVYYWEEDKRLLEYYQWDGTQTPLLEIPESLWGAHWSRSEDGFVAAGGTRRLALLDEEGQEKSGNYLTGRVAGMLSDPATGEALPYGFEREELVVWGQDAQVRSRITDQIGAYDEFAMAISDTGEILLANASQAWLYQEGEDGIQELFSFQKLEYPVDQIYGCAFGEDGTFRFYIEFDGEKSVLTAQLRESSQIEEKQEVTLFEYSNPSMERAAVRYNRQSEKYHVRIIGVENPEERKDYCQRVLLEMTTGAGPDLLTDEIFYGISDTITEYLEPLDGIVGDMSPFIESAFEAGKTENSLYRIPIQCYPKVLTVSRQVTEKDSWTLEEMMEEVRASGAEVLQYGSDGVDIVMQYGLYDEGNTAFIDWEKGESHLTQPPFLELLAFAREYASNGQYETEEIMDCLADGRIAGTELSITNAGELNKVRDLFNGEGKLIGYPRESGNGIYMHVEGVYMNRSASNKEGAADFLRYLLSEEGQQKYSEDGEFGGVRPFMARRSVNEQVIEDYQRKVTNPPIRHFTGAFSWEINTLDEEQIAQYWWLIDNAVPDNVPAAGIRAIVEEELQPYFHGDCSAEHAAEILDSRVQLYLDERK